jgi:hypothetical protein
MTISQRIYYLGVVIAMFTTLSAHSQLRIGIVGSLNYAKIDKAKIRDRYATERHVFYGIGCVLDIDLIRQLSLRVEPLFLQKGGIFQDISNPNNPKMMMEITCIEVPVMLKVTFGNTIKPYFMAGPSIGFITKGGMYLIKKPKKKGDMKYVLKDTDWGLSLGGGLSIQLNICTVFLESYRTFGLKNIIREGPVDICTERGTRTGGLYYYDNGTDMVKTKGFQVLAGVSFPLRLF